MYAIQLATDPEHREFCRRVSRVCPEGEWLLPTGRGMGTTYFGLLLQAQKFASRADATAEARKLPSYFRLGDTINIVYVGDAVAHAVIDDLRHLR